MKCDADYKWDETVPPAQCKQSVMMDALITVESINFHVVSRVVSGA